MNRIDRLVAIVLLLQSRRLIRAQDIADHFAISTRTVYRDLQALEEAGVPIAAEVGEGYSLVEGYLLPPVMFSAEEASALFIGGEFVDRLTDASLKKHIQPALLKIRSVLPHDKQDYLDRLQAATEIRTHPNIFSEGFRDDVLIMVQDAIVHCRVLSMEYHTLYRDTIAKRDIEPVGLLYYSDHWHLIAFCRLRQDYRDFRTDRIKTIKCRDETFRERKDFSLKKYVQEFNRLDNPQEAQVKFPTQIAQRIRNRQYFGMVEETVTADDVLMTFLVPTLEVLVGWLLSFGTEVEIVYPDRLRHLLLQQAKMLAAHYDPAHRQRRKTKITANTAGRRNDYR